MAHVREENKTEKQIRACTSDGKIKSSYLLRYQRKRGLDPKAVSHDIQKKVLDEPAALCNTDAQANAANGLTFTTQTATAETSSSQDSECAA